MAYWCDQRLRLVIAREGVADRSITLRQPFARIGSHPDGDLSLIGHDVPARGYYLHATTSGAFCVDLRRTTTSSLSRGRWLKQGETLQLGSYGLSVALESVCDPVAPTGPLDGRGEIAHPSPILGIYGGNQRLAERRLKADLTIVGRWPGCGIELNGQRVSGVHCALYWCDGRLWCVDLVSSNGTQLGDVGVSCSEVQLGERLEMGGFGLVYERLSEPASPSQAPARSAPTADLTSSSLTEPEHHAHPVPPAAQPNALDCAASRRVGVTTNGRANRSSAECDSLAQKKNLGGVRHGRLPRSNALDATAAAKIDSMSLEQIERAAARLDRELHLVDEHAEYLVAKLETLAVIRFKLEMQRSKLLGRFIQTGEMLAAAAPQSGSDAGRLRGLGSHTEQRMGREEYADPVHLASCDFAAAGPQSSGGTEDDCFETGDASRSEHSEIRLLEPSAQPPIVATDGLPDRITPRVIPVGKVFEMADTDKVSATLSGFAEDSESARSSPATELPNDVDTSCEDETESNLAQESHAVADCAPVAVSSTSGSEVEGVPPRSERGAPKSTRRTTHCRGVDQDDLVDYVSNRMITLERQKGRRKVLVGLAIALGLLIVLSAAGGSWYQWGQEYLPIPESVVQQAPEWMANWFRSIATAVR